ncbi:MAG: DNA alkylation repair protein, partial [Pseudomonadota bacterium]
MERLLIGLKPYLSALDTEQKIELATRLIASGYGEQKTIALALLEAVPEYFAPQRFDHLESLISGLQGWSKIDRVTRVVLPRVLEIHERDMIELLGHWNAHHDLWLRRASVVIFTRKIAKSGSHKDVALRHCNALLYDPEYLVQTGVGWCLRDLMRWHKGELLNYVRNIR